MLMFTQTQFGQLRIGQMFFMFDIFMIKTDVSASVAIGHVDHLGFHLDYLDDLKSRGLLPFNIQQNVPVSVVSIQESSFPKCHNSDIDLFQFTGNIPTNDIVEYIYIQNGIAYIKISDGEGFHTFFPINEIPLIEGEGQADYGIEDCPNTMFVRGDNHRIQYYHFTKD